MLKHWLIFIFVQCAIAGWVPFTPSGKFADYGCAFINPSARLGYLVETNLTMCQRACLNSLPLTGGINSGCSAIEWNDQSGWCNLYTELCTSSFVAYNEPWDGMDRPWHRYFIDDRNAFRLRCALPHEDPGALHCVTESGLNCYTRWEIGSQPYGEVSNPTGQGGIFIQCPDAGVSGEKYGLRVYGTDPCQVLGCKKILQNAAGFHGYRYETFAPTRQPTTKAPTLTPSSHPTTVAPSRAPTSPLSSGETSSPTSQPSTAMPTKSPTTDSPTLHPSTQSPTTSLPSRSPTLAPTDGTCDVEISSWLLYKSDCQKLMQSGSSCDLVCRLGTPQREKNVLNCTNGELSPLTPCNLTNAPPNTNASYATLSFGLDFTLGCKINTSKSEDVALVTDAFAQNIARELNIPNFSLIDLTTRRHNNNSLNFTLVLRDRLPNSTALGDAQIITNILNDAKRRANFFLFYFFVNETMCVTQGELIYFDIDFDSLFQYLFNLVANLPTYAVALLLGALVVLIIWIPYSNRTSPHPFAVLLGIVSMFSLASRIYFIVFVGRLASVATELDSSLAQLRDVHVAAAAFIAISLTLNSLSALLLIIGLRASSVFQKRWFELHPVSLVFGFFISVFNPGNILILRSQSWGLEAFKAPFPVEHLRRLELIGIVCALVGDFPPLILTVFTMIIVQDSIVLDWKQTITTLALPVVFSGFVIIVALLMRGCKIQRYTTTLKSNTSQNTSMVDLNKTVDIN